jgi:hypothetical protein
LQIGLFNSLVETHASLQGKTAMLVAGELVHCFTVGIDLGFERNTSFISMVSRWRYALFAPNRPIQLS